MDINWHDLEQWQACNHPLLAEKSPEELFSPEFAVKYNILHRDIWMRMTRLHGTIATLETLQEFPFRVVYAPSQMEFWRLVGTNFLEMSIVLVFGLTIDEGSGVCTLHHLRNEIAKATWDDKHLKGIWQDQLRQGKIDANLRALEARVDKLRNNRIAHRLRDRSDDLPKNDLEGVSLAEMRQLYTWAHRLFGVLSFGSAYVTLAGDLIHSSVGGKTTPTCLQTVLEAVLKDSHFVNEPETKESCWPKRKELKSEEKIALMNELRKRVGLPVA